MRILCVIPGYWPLKSGGPMFSVHELNRALVLLFSPIFYLIFSTVDSESNISVALKGVLIGGLVASFFESWIYSVGSAYAFPFWICVVLLLKLKIHPELFNRKEEGVDVKMDKSF